MRHFLKRIFYSLLLGLVIFIPENQSFAVGYPVSNGPSLNENIFISLAERVVPSVVNISSIYTVKNPNLTPDDFFKYFFGGKLFDGTRGNPAPPKSLRAMSLGSGFIIDPSGIILTNSHVVSGADEIKIQFTENDEKSVDGKVVGRDPDLDIALIRVNTSHPLTSLALGDSDEVKVGAFVMAVGNPFGQGHSVSHGIISAKGRLNPDFPIGNYIQTDAPINPGNSGGPLVDLNGNVIGVNTAIQAHAQGIGFAIASNLIKQILPQLQSNGTVERGYIGISVGPLLESAAGRLKVPEGIPVVDAITPGGPADRAGIRESDVILQLDGAPVRSPTELITKVTSLRIGSKVPVMILRGGRQLPLTVDIGKRPVSNINDNG